MSHPNLVGGSGAPTGPFAVHRRTAVAAGCLFTVCLILVPFVDRGIAYLAALAIVPIALYAVRFGLRGGLVAAAVGVAVAFIWLLSEQDITAGLPTFGVRTALFVLIGGLVGSVVSERSRYEVAVTAHNEMSLELISTASFDGYFTRLNPAWTDVLGWDLAELMARPFADFIHPDDVRDAAPEAVRQTVAGLPVITFQNRYRCRDGSYRWLEWTSRSDQSARMVYGVARDITARKEAEDAIATFQEALERAVQERTADLEERTKELDESRLETLRRLALAAEYRDDETFEHTERVGRMAAELASQLGISAEQAEILRWAAPLHDVGKLGLSDTIVLKPGKLTSEETAEVRKHPENGARILAHSNSDVLQLAEQIALGHHEWWDGSGYPRGLAGEEIPLCARIVALADVYDALTHARPYKEAWSVQKAIDEICLLRGRQFDPRIVDAFLRLARISEWRPAELAAISNGSARLLPQMDEAEVTVSEQRFEQLLRASEYGDQTAADEDQFQADSRQTTADADQLESNADQALADREQQASDRDQDAADAELSHDPGERLALALEASRVERDAATVKRDAATAKRDAATVVRDAATMVRDVATVEHDAASRERDSTADESTGVFRRGAGEVALIHEIDRAQCSGRSLVLVVIDIDALEAVDDGEGHAAGDALFRDVPTTIAATLRSYDVTVRWGTDEFVCGLSEITLEETIARIDDIRRALDARWPGASISAGLAELSENDTLESLLARAATDLYRANSSREVVVHATSS